MVDAETKGVSFRAHIETEILSVLPRGYDWQVRVR